MKTILKRSLALFLSLMLLMPCLLANAQSGITRAVRGSETPMGDEGWTIFVYLCGSDLETDGGCATEDLIEMCDATPSDKVRIVVQTGGAAEWQNDLISSGKTERYLIQDGDIEQLQTLSKANMGKASTLADFLTWGVSNYASEKMGLVFWNHGGGSISGVCFDENNDYNSLGLKDIESALSTVSGKMTDRFEFIGFDACLMSTLETANMLVPYARYMYASEELEPGTGWDYTSLLNYGSLSIVGVA